MLYDEVQKIFDSVKNIPYPKVQNLRRNLNLANEIYRNYAGKDGELTAITQYIYEHLDIQNQEVAKIMREVSIQEMHHLDMLGGIIQQLGRNPYYIDTNGKSWTTNYVEYATGDLANTMKFNIQAESIAIHDYQSLKRYISNPSLRALIDRIIVDEQTHQKVFQTIAQTIK